jgi:hypothetical protein
MRGGVCFSVQRSLFQPSKRKHPRPTKTIATFQTPKTSRLFPPTRWSAEFNALIASSAFSWLVGPTELREADVVVSPGGGSGSNGSGNNGSSSSGGGGIVQTAAAAAAGAADAPQIRRQRSLVHIKKCRYLEASGCVALWCGRGGGGGGRGAFKDKRGGCLKPMFCVLLITTPIPHTTHPHPPKPAPTCARCRRSRTLPRSLGCL